MHHHSSLPHFPCTRLYSSTTGTSAFAFDPDNFAPIASSALLNLLPPPPPSEPPSNPELPNPLESVEVEVPQMELEAFLFV